MLSHHRAGHAAATPLPPATLSPTHHQHPGRQRRSQRALLSSPWPGGALGCPHGGCWGRSASSLRLGRSRSCSSQGPKPRLHGLRTPAGPAQTGVQVLELASHHRTPSTEPLQRGEAAMELPSCHIQPTWLTCPAATTTTDFLSLSFTVLLGIPSPGEVGASRSKLEWCRL